MKKFKSIFKNKKENCTYPKCKKEVHEEGSKYCGVHQRKVVGIRGVVLKSTISLGSVLVFAAIKPIREKFKV